jgi:carbon-monoxide dehydrogenase large subunit
MSDQAGHHQRADIGSRVERREDAPYLTGDAAYTDDIQPSNTTHLAILRSQYAHAQVDSLDTSTAARRDDVLTVLTRADLAEADVPGTIPVGWEMPGMCHPDYHILAGETARYQGEPLAAVVAEDRYAAHGALDDIDVAYDRLEPVVEPREALHDDAPTVHEDAPDNVAVDWEVGDDARTDEAFADAENTVGLAIRNQRVHPTAMEPRGALAEYDRSSGTLSVHMSSQNPHIHRRLLSTSLAHPENRIRVVSPDVGGGFGSKSPLYPGETLAAWSACRLERPVKWQATRTEGYLSDAHGRGIDIEAELAFDDDGTIRGLRSDAVANNGAYQLFFAPHVPTIVHGSALSGAYDIPAIHARIVCAYTNTVPMDAYRGAGQPEACFLVERLVDTAARELGVDPVAFRRQNVVDPDQFPFTTRTGAVYDSGDYRQALDRALDTAGYDALRERQRELRGEGRYLGIGVSTFTQSSGMGPSRLLGESGAKHGFWESSLIRFQPSGTVTAYVGTHSHGQGHETSFAQILSDRLGVPPEDVEIVEGDTDRVQSGQGTYGSRSGPVGGGALAQCADKVVEKARRIAAHHLEADADDVVFEDGQFHPAGAPGRTMGIGEVARQAYLAHDVPEGLEPGLEETAFYDPEGFTSPFGTHVVAVEVDPRSGEVEVERYVAVTDCGTQINPTIVEGQIHGAIAQGFGQARHEGVVYDEQGNLVTGSMQDYAVPKATQVPEVETDSTVTESPHNPLGVKGVGEAGTIASPPAVVNAIVDALEPFGVEHLEMPVTSETVWQAVRTADGEPGR